MSCGEAVNPQILHGIYDKIEIPEVKPIVTQVQQRALLTLPQRLREHGPNWFRTRHSFWK